MTTGPPQNEDRGAGTPLIVRKPKTPSPPSIHAQAPIERLLERLDGVRQVAPSQYAAKCPAHDDKSPSLSIKDLGDRLLIFCHAACEPSDVMSAVGLSLADLFVRRDWHASHHHAGHGPVHIRQRWDSRAMLKLLNREAQLVLVAAGEVARGQQLAPDDHERLRIAVERIVRVSEAAG